MSERARRLAEHGAAIAAQQRGPERGDHPHPRAGFGRRLRAIRAGDPAEPASGVPGALVRDARGGRISVEAVAPDGVVMRVGAQWAYSKEHHQLFEKDPTWIGVGFIVADLGALILLLATGFAFWWQRSQKAVAGRVVSGLAVLYLILLVVAWLAMSGKWGS